MFFVLLIPAALGVSFVPSVASCVLISSSMKDRADLVSRTASVWTLLAALENRTAIYHLEQTTTPVGGRNGIRGFFVKLTIWLSFLSMKQSVCVFLCYHLCHEFFSTTSDSLDILLSNTKNRFWVFLCSHIARLLSFSRRVDSSEFCSLHPSKEVWWRTYYSSSPTSDVKVVVFCLSWPKLLVFRVVPNCIFELS